MSDTVTTRRVELPMQTRLAPVGSVDAETRTAEVTWTTGARVKRARLTPDWDVEHYLEELSLDPSAVDLSRLRAGAPLLDSHQRWELRNVIGVVERADLAGAQGTASVRFSARDDVRPIFDDVRAGVLRQISVGYTVERMERSGVDADSGLPVYTATRWTPMELSLVPIGADPGAGVRAEGGAAPKLYPCEISQPAVSATTRKESMMDEATRAAEEAAKRSAEAQAKAEGEAKEAATKAAQEAAERAVKAERERAATITALVARHGLGDAFAAELIGSDRTLDAARAAILDKLAERSQQQAPARGVFIQTITDQTETERAGAVEALLFRANPGGKQLSDNGKRFAGMTLRELMRDRLEARGVNTRGMSVNEMWERTYLSGSDLPNIVLDAANKSLRAAYDSTPRTFTAWCRQTTAPDFKNINRIQLSGAPSLLKVLPGEEIKRGEVSDAKETYQLATYARIVGINRQTIINDDMDAFTRLPALAARAAADVESDTVYAVLTANAAMADGVALFHANHGNLGSGAIGITALDAARAAMRVQTGLEGRPINVAPRYLIVPAAKETTAEQFTSLAIVAAKQTDTNPFRSGGPSALIPVVEPRLDATSTLVWYAAADPAQVDTVEYAYLEGEQGVYLESRMGFDIDGMELKVRLDFAAKAIDHRGLYKSTGA